MKKRYVILTAVLAVCLLAAVLLLRPKADEPEELPEWAVYWYLCGSDLETNYGCGKDQNGPKRLTVVMEGELSKYAR